MIEINLREFYPECYISDYFVEVPDEVAELLTLLRRHEQSHPRRKYLSVSQKRNSFMTH